ncbi:MAG: FG-GAP-like repeat-containing protein [Bacteroidia bacterium]|nr:FG-GAP-like repeat-containing protein [Bacteroidia bacterium]
MKNRYLIILLAFLFCQTVKAQWRELGGTDSSNFDFPFFYGEASSWSNIYATSDEGNFPSLNTLKHFNGIGFNQSLQHKTAYKKNKVTSTGALYVSAIDSFVRWGHSLPDYYSKLYRKSGNSWIKYPNTLGTDTISISSFSVSNSGQIYAVAKLVYIGFSWPSQFPIPIKWNSISEEWQILSGGENWYLPSSLISSGVYDFEITTDWLGNPYIFGSIADSSDQIFILRWTGFSWTRIGNAQFPTFYQKDSVIINGNRVYSRGFVESLVASGPNDVYVEGELYNANDSPYVAHWDGTKWEELKGVSIDYRGLIGNLQLSPIGDVYVGGWLSDNLQRPGIYKWNKSFWTYIPMDTITDFAWYNNNNLIYTNVINLQPIYSDSFGRVAVIGNLKNGNGKYYVAQFDPVNKIPVFKYGNTSQVFVRVNSGAVSFANELMFTDSDVAQYEYFTVSKWPQHGTLFTGNHAQSGVDISPLGWTYSPDNNYSGQDTIVIRVDDGHGGLVKKTLVITVSNPIAGVISANQTICTGTQPAAISLTGSVGYVQWQVSTNGFVFNNIAGASSAILSPAAMGNLIATRYYRAVVSAGVMSVTSATSTVAISPCTSAYLYDIQLSKNTLAPFFSMYDTAYSAVFNYSDSVVKFTLTQEDVLANSRIRKNNGAWTSLTHLVQSGDFVLGLGSNNYQVQVTSANNQNTFTYYLNLYRTGLPPTITSINRIQSRIGQTVRVIGSGFNSTPSNNKINLRSIQTSPISTSGDTLMDFVFPAGASISEVGVYNLATNLSATSSQQIVPTFSPSKDTLLASDFSAATDLNTLSSGAKNVFADLDGDSKTDLVVANSGSSSVSIYPSTSTLGTISFGTRIDISVGSWWSGSPDFIRAADLDGDGKLDLVFTMPGGSTISVLHNLSTAGNISFDPVQNFSGLFASASDLEIADVNMDGKLDIVYPNGMYNVSCLLNQSLPGTINLGNRLDISFGGNPSAIAIADYDLDNKPDLAVSWQSDTLLTIYRNTSTGQVASFAAGIDIACGLNPNSLQSADLNGDTKNDLFGTLYAGGIFFIKNTSTLNSLSFAGFQNLSGSSVNSVALSSDFNGDGKPDISFLGGNSPWSNSIFIARNTSSSGQITFSNPVEIGSNPFQTIYFYQSVDLDSDGKSDFASVRYNGNAYVNSVIKNNLQCSNSYLHGISLSQGVLAPVFDSLKLDYLVNVANAVSSIQLTTVFGQPLQTVNWRINGGVNTGISNNVASASIPISTGNNLLEILVTGSDGLSHQTYSLTLFRDPVVPPSLFVTVEVFPQGLFDGFSGLVAAPYNANNSYPGALADTITIELHDTGSGFPLAFSWTGELWTSGTTNAEFSYLADGKLFYLVVKHRNSVETWSANPIIISNLVSYSFADSDTSAYGNNLISLGNGIYGIYAGDINQDGSVDFLDYPDLDLGALNGDLGYLVTDLNGDASVDFLDYPLIDLNALNGVVIQRP